MQIDFLLVCKFSARAKTEPESASCERRLGMRELAGKKRVKGFESGDICDIIFLWKRKLYSY